MIKRILILLKNGLWWILAIVGGYHCYRYFNGAAFEVADEIQLLPLLALIGIVLGVIFPRRDRY